MPRRPRIAMGGQVFHVLNRRVGRLPLFKTPSEYAAFEAILQEAFLNTRVRIAAYCLMPKHWHLLLWPREDGELSEIMRWITVTHTQRWNSQRHTAGMGPIYQGRFRSFPIQTDDHFLTVARYVEANPLRAKLVPRAEEWRWGSLWCRAQEDPKYAAFLSEWPVKRPDLWRSFVNQAETLEGMFALRRSVQRGRPFGDPRWQKRMAKRLGLESTLRPRGRPKGS